MSILSELGISAQNSGVGSKEWVKAGGEWIDSVNPATGKTDRQSAVGDGGRLPPSRRSGS